MITIERLKECLQYDRKTGVFFWRIHLRGGPKAGSVAGSHNGNGYLRICIDGERYYAHQLAWFYVHGYWVDLIDHKDRDGMNNRFRNLRPTNQSHNIANGPSRRDGLKGAYLSSDGRWFSSIRINGGKIKYLGRFSSEDEAHRAYMKAAKELHGEFARAA